MGEETVQVLDRRVRLRNVVLLHAPVRIHICPRCDYYLSDIIVFFVFYSGGGVGTLNGTHRIAEAHYNPSIGLGFSDIDM